MLKRKTGLILITCLSIAALAALAAWLPGRLAPRQAVEEARTSLIFWTVNDSYAAYMLDCAERFNQANPQEKIALDVKVYSRSFIVDQIRKSLSNETQVPDLVDIQFNDFNKFVSSSEHTLLLYPLDSLLSGQNEARPDCLEAFSFNDALLAVPYGAGRMALFYNAPAFEALGLSSQDLKSWDAFFSCGDRLAQRGGPSLFAVDVRNNDLFFAMMLQADPDAANASRLQISAAPSFQQVRSQLLTALKSGSACIPEEFDIYNQQFLDSFAAGDCLCAIAPMEFAGELMQRLPQMAGKIAIAPLPDQSEDVPLVAQYGTAITSKGKNIALAKKFLRFAKLNAEAYAALTQALYVKNISEDPSVASLFSSDPQFQDYFLFKDGVEAWDGGTERGFWGKSGLPEAVLEDVPALLRALEEEN